MNKISEITGLSPLHTRYMMFLIGCIGMRSLFVYGAFKMDKEYLKWMSIPAVILTIGWLAIYFFGLRDTGGEVFGEKIWWNHMRPVHALFYLVFAVLAFKGDDRAYIPLGVDVVVGLGAFLWHHFG